MPAHTTKATLQSIQDLIHGAALDNSVIAFVCLVKLYILLLLVSMLGKRSI